MDIINTMGKINNLSSLPTPNSSQFLLSQFAACDVRKSIISINSNAVGSDGISRNMVLPILDEILPIMCHIFNYSISINVRNNKLFLSPGKVIRPTSLIIIPYLFFLLSLKSSNVSLIQKLPHFLHPFPQSVFL